MNYFRWDSEDDLFATVTGATKDDRKASAPQFYGQSKLPSVTFRVVPDPKGELPLADCVNFGLPQPKIISDRAKQILSRFLESKGVFKPAVIEGAESPYWMWMSSVSANCLNEVASVIYETFTGYRRVNEAVFDVDRIPSEAVFVLKGFEFQSVWVREDFKSAVELAGLRGFRLNEAATLRSNS